jgi:uncharacterized protein YeaO (DUF488 family)
MIQIKRVYDPPARNDGVRFLVERLWPRGVKKEKLKLTGWIKDVAPSTELRQWFGHDPSRWEEFQKRYRTELDTHPEAWQPILAMAKQGNVTLLVSSHDAAHNNVVALKAYLENRCPELKKRRQLSDD